MQHQLPDFTQKHTKYNFGWVSGGAYSAPPDPLAGGKGAGCPSLTPALGPSGLHT